MINSAFFYRNGALCVEDVSIDKIAAETGTPFYCYSSARIRQNYHEFAGAFAGKNVRICFAIKSNPNQAVVRTLADCGAGADITSIGELERALQAGIRPEKIVFSGVGKKYDEIIAALLAGIYQFNVESIPELRAINQVASELGKIAPISLRINPDVNARTFQKTSTGELGTKFGIEMDQINEALGIIQALPSVKLFGFTVHIGSHVHDYEPFREAYGKLADFVRKCRAQGFTIQRLDLGGGVGIPHDGEKLPPFSDYVRIVDEAVGNLGCELIFEPGRKLVGDAGILVSRVVYLKQGSSRRFIIIDAGMNDLVRPALYGARHSILPVHESTNNALPADVVGPVCETSDLFGKDYMLPGVGQGDLVAILQAGCYGASMSSNYNGRPLIPEIMVAGAQHAIVRRRIAVAEQIAWESLPSWMSLRSV